MSKPFETKIFKELRDYIDVDASWHSTYAAIHHNTQSEVETYITSLVNEGIEAAQREGLTALRMSNHSYSVKGIVQSGVFKGQREEYTVLYTTETIKRNI